MNEGDLQCSPETPEVHLLPPAPHPLVILHMYIIIIFKHLLKNRLANQSQILYETLIGGRNQFIYKNPGHMTKMAALKIFAGTGGLFLLPIHYMVTSFGVIKESKHSKLEIGNYMVHRGVWSVLNSAHFEKYCGFLINTCTRQPTPI